MLLHPKPLAKAGEVDLAQSACWWGSPFAGSLRKVFVLRNPEQDKIG